MVYRHDVACAVLWPHSATILALIRSLALPGNRSALDDVIRAAASAVALRAHVAGILLALVAWVVWMAWLRGTERGEMRWPWLFPLAWAASSLPQYAWILVILAYLPLLLGMVRSGKFA